MGIAFTKKPIVYNPVVRADTSQHLRDDIDQALLTAGWVHIRTITNGFVYKCGSPQNLVARLRVQDTGSTVQAQHVIEFQFMSDDETHLGRNHKLFYNLLSQVPKYQIWVNICQVFVSVPGRITRNGASGGIPFLPFNVSGDCAADNLGPLLVNEMWWSSGDTDPSQTFRSSRFSEKGTYSFCKNGVVSVPAGDGSSLVSGALNLGPLEGTAFVDQTNSHPPQTLTYLTLNPFDVEPLLLHNYQIQGQLWDSFMRTKLINPVDSATTTVETNGLSTFAASWISYNESIVVNDGQGTYFATLYLLQGLDQTSGGEESNYAY